MAGHDTRSEVFDHDVGHGRQISHQCRAIAMGEVHTDVAFASILLHKVGGLTCHLAAPCSGDITIGWLHLDHIGPQVGQRPTRHRPGKHPGQIQDAYALQRAG